LQIAFLSSRVPALGVYLVAPSLIAFIPAWTQATKLTKNLPPLPTVTNNVSKTHYSELCSEIQSCNDPNEIVVTAINKTINHIKVFTIKLARTFTNSRRIRFDIHALHQDLN